MIGAGKSIRRFLRKFLPRKDFVKISGSIIPSPERRWCGREFKDDEFYLQSAEHEADRLVKHFQCTQKSRILDVGCGQGRLANGILRVIGEINYLGLDVDRRSIDWCKRYLERDHPAFQFKLLNLHNERYNPTGIRLDDHFRFDVDPHSVNIIYLYSVFSHTTEEDMRVYLKEFSRILDDRGRLFFTTFVEEHVPDFSINPDGYRLKCSGPLHIVRYDKDHLFRICAEYGYSISSFTHQTESDGQSAIYLAKNSERLG